jgi:hypothetical protein
MNALPAAMAGLVFIANAAFAQLGIPPAVVDQARGFYLPQKPEFTMRGERFVFQQETLERNFAGCYSLLADRVKSGNTDNETPASALAYCIIAAGEFAKPTPELLDLLEQVRKTLGKLPVPASVDWPDRSYLGAVSMSFVDKKGEGFDSAGLMQKETQTFEDLVSGARLKMAIREKKPAE